MILNEQEILGIVDEEQIYQCSLINRRFALSFFKEDISPFGNIVIFESKVKLGSMYLKKALIIGGELPNTNMFGGICLQRLYTTLLGSLLSVITGKECFVDESCVFVEGVQASISITNKIKDSVVFHIMFPIDTEVQELSKLSLNEKDMQTFKTNCIESFKHLTKSIFLETQRDNF
jgi:hypothetical protein